MKADIRSWLVCMVLFLPSIGRAQCLNPPLCTVLVPPSLVGSLPQVAPAPTPAPVLAYAVVVALSPVHAMAVPSIPRATSMYAASSRDVLLEDLYKLRRNWVEYCQVEGIRANFENALMVLTTGPGTIQIDVKNQRVTYEAEDVTSPSAVDAVMQQCPAALARLEREIAANNGWTYDKRRQWSVANAQRARRMYESWLANLRIESGKYQVRVSDQAPTTASIVLPQEEPNRPLILKAWGPSDSEVIRSCTPTQEITRKWVSEPVRAGFDQEGKPYYNTVSRYIDIVIDKYPAGCK